MTDDSSGIRHKGPLERAVMRDLRAVAPTGSLPKYEGASLLARMLAQAIDEEPARLKDLSPRLLATLSALGLTAKAATLAATPTPDTPAAPSGGDINGGQRVSTLAERRERHRQEKAARAHGA